MPRMSIQAALDSSIDVRARGLAALGLIESPTASFDPPWPADCTRTPRACQQVSLWAIHGITHGVGLEVHDPIQAYFGDRTFQKGDAFVIEPGVYITTRQLAAHPSRAVLDREERVVKDGILRMGSLVETQIREAVRAVAERDRETAASVIATSTASSATSTVAIRKL